MSSDIFFRNGQASLADSAATFFGKPFWEICRRINERAAKHHHLILEASTKYAKQDNFLDVSGLDVAGRNLIIEEVDAILSDESFFDWEKEWKEQPWYPEACRLQGTTPDEHISLMHESTQQQLIHLRQKLKEMNSQANQP